MEEIRLRPATPADGEFLYELHRRTLGDVIEATWGPWDDVQPYERLGFVAVAEESPKVRMRLTL